MQINLIINKLSGLAGGSFIIEYKNIEDIETIKNDIFRTLYTKTYEIELNFFELSPEKDSSVISVGQIRDLKKCTYNLFIFFYEHQLLFFRKFSLSCS